MLNVLSNLIPLVSSGFDYNYNYSTSSELDSGVFAGFWLVYLCCIFTFLIIIYLLQSYITMKLAENNNLEDKKMLAWIPYFGTPYIYSLITKKDTIWIVLAIFIPVFQIILLYELVINVYKKDILYFLGILFIPILNFYLLWKLAKEKPVA
jgi:hypothetical protein